MHISLCENHFAKFEHKGMITVGATDYTKKAPLSIADGEQMYKFNTPQNERKIMKQAQNRRCTFSICEQSLGKV